MFTVCTLKLGNKLRKPRARLSTPKTSTYSHRRKVEIKLVLGVSRRYPSEFWVVSQSVILLSACLNI